MGRPGVGCGKSGDPAGSQGCGVAQGLGSYGEKKPQWGDLGGKRGVMQPRGSPSRSKGRWRCTSGLGGGLKAPQKVTDALKVPDHALAGEL